MTTPAERLAAHLEAAEREIVSAQRLIDGIRHVRLVQEHLRIARLAVETAAAVSEQPAGLPVDD
jgi:hypothetical protein